MEASVGKGNNFLLMVLGVLITALCGFAYHISNASKSEANQLVTEVATLPPNETTTSRIGVTDSVTKADPIKSTGRPVDNLPADPEIKTSLPTANLPVTEEKKTVTLKEEIKATPLPKSAPKVEPKIDPKVVSKTVLPKTETPAKMAEKVVTPTTKYSTTLVYAVKPADNLFDIATRYNVTRAQLKTLNSLKDETIKEGQTLKIPIQAMHKISSGEGWLTLSVKYKIDKASVVKANAMKKDQLQMDKTLVIPLPKESVK